MPARLHHRGLTFLEVVVSLALLATLASSILGAISFMETAGARARFRLDATEVAHRLITQYIDNQALMPPDNLPIQQGDHLYRWTLREEILAREEGPGSLARRSGRIASQMTAMEQIPEMLNRLTLEVYLDDPDDPLSHARPIARLNRIYSPITTGDPDEVRARILKLVGQANEESAQSTRPDAPPRPPSTRN